MSVITDTVIDTFAEYKVLIMIYKRSSKNKTLNLAIAWLSWGRNLWKKMIIKQIMWLNIRLNPNICFLL